MGAPPQTFPKRVRVRRRPEYLAIQHRGLRVSGQLMFASALADAQSGAEGARLGLTVSRKVGNAVKRNRVKRVLRDWFRRHRLDCPAAAIVFVARNGAAEAPADALRAEADDIVRRMARRLSEGRRPRTDRSERPETPR